MGTLDSSRIASFTYKRASNSALRLFFLRHAQIDMQIAQLLRFDWCRASVIRSVALAVFGNAMTSWLRRLKVKDLKLKITDWVVHGDSEVDMQSRSRWALLVLNIPFPTWPEIESLGIERAKLHKWGTVESFFDHLIEAFGRIDAAARN